MFYIKLFGADGRLIGAEALSELVYVRWQTNNGKLVRCKEDDAQGIISADGNTVYLINHQMPHGIPEPYAEFITQEEYEEISGEDPEDESPAVPDPEEPPMTRSELTAAVQMLMECLLEMSEIVYG